MDKSDFINLVKSRFEAILGKNLKEVNETRFASLKYEDKDGRKIQIRGYKFEPYPEPDEYMYAVKFKVLIDGNTSPQYELLEYYDEENEEDGEFGVTKNALHNNDILNNIYYLLELLE